MADLVERAFARGFGGLGFFGCRKCAAVWQQLAGTSRRCPECAAAAVALDAAEASAIMAELTRMVAADVGEMGVEGAVAATPGIPAGVARVIAEAALAADDAFGQSAAPPPAPTRPTLRVVRDA